MQLKITNEIRKWLEENGWKRSHDSNHTLIFWIIDIYCVHKLSLLKIIAMDKYQFYSLPIQSTVVWHECTYSDSTCIKRTLRMRNWLSVLITDAKSKKESDIPIAPSLYSLSNEMDKSLLAVRDINHKYIVVERMQ